METRDKLIEIILNTDQCYDCCRIKIGYLSDELIKSGLIVDDKIYPPKCVIDEEYTAEFICDKCNTSVAFFTLCDRSFPYKQDILQNAKKVGKLKQLYPNYCSNCGCKLKE